MDKGLSDALLATAGAYLLCRGRFVFAVGPARSGDGLAIIRLGGHMESGESGMQCAARELREEAAVQATFVPPPATYWVGDDGTVGPMEARLQGTVRPLLLSRHGGGSELSATYLAVTDQEPSPSSEVRGLLLLDVPSVRRVTSRQTTLEEFIDSGGTALLREPLDPHLPLQPFTELRVLPQLLALHPKLAAITAPDRGHI